MAEVGLFHILDGCPYLEKLDLTSCRGVKVGERRRFFEVWAVALLHHRPLTSPDPRFGRNGKTQTRNWFHIISTHAIHHDDPNLDVSQLFTMLTLLNTLHSMTEHTVSSLQIYSAQIDVAA